MNADMQPTPGRLHDGCMETHAMRLYGKALHFCKNAGDRQDLYGLTAVRPYRRCRHRGMVLPVLARTKEVI